MQILGVNDRGGIQHVKMIEEMRKEFHWRKQMVTESDRMEAIDILAITDHNLQFQNDRLELEEIKTNRKKNKKNTPPRKRPSLEIRRG